MPGKLKYATVFIGVEQPYRRVYQAMITPDGPALHGYCMEEPMISATGTDIEAVANALRDGMQQHMNNLEFAMPFALIPIGHEANMPMPSGLHFQCWFEPAINGAAAPKG